MKVIPPQDWIETYSNTAPLDRIKTPEQAQEFVRAVQLNVEAAILHKIRQRKCVHCGQTQPG